MGSNLFLFFPRKRTLLRQHHDWNSVFIQIPFGDYDEIPRWILDSLLMQRLHSDRNHAQGFARLTELPARDRDHAIGSQVLEIFPECLHGVETVFAQGERTGGS